MTDDRTLLEKARTATLSEALIADFEMLARYVALNLREQPQQQALILRKLGKIFAELHPEFADDDLLYPYLRDPARSWLALKSVRAAASLGSLDEAGKD